MGNLIPLGPPEAPTRFRLWKPGNNPGDYGNNVVTREACQRVMDAYARRGAAIAIDIQHATNPKLNPEYDPAKPPVMGGYAELQVVETSAGPEVWATGVRWSDCRREHAAPGEVCCAKHQIETGQRAYVSPDWMLDPDTREPIAINRLSLVAEPGTYGINMLAARAVGRSVTMDDMAVLKALLQGAMAAASSQDADIQAMGQALAQQIQALATTKGLDLSAEPAPVSEAGEQQQKEPMAAMAVADLEKAIKSVLAGMNITPRPAPSPAPASAAAGKGVTEADMRRIASEESERRELIAANKERLGPFAPLLSAKPLAEVKGFIAAAASKANEGEVRHEGPKGAPVKAPGSIEGSAPVSLVGIYGKAKK